jgi:mannose-6-phosphate isomerase
MLEHVSLLQNPVLPYDWGSKKAIPDLLGQEPDGRPQAELWIGAHPSAPSTILSGYARGHLDRVILGEPLGVLGTRVLEEFGPRLPYLLKVLAADRALSLQVHPLPHLARAGFNRENAAGVPRDAPDRTFHDPHHKPEMVLALTQFDGLVGFRRPRVVLDHLDGLTGTLVDDVRGTLRTDPSPTGIRTAFRDLVARRDLPSVAHDIEVTLASVRDRIAQGSPVERADRTVLALAEQHPGDPGVLASLMLNRVTLEPGESVFIPAGVVHAYLAGVAVEVMASSDNVLRAGLTRKHVDVDALVTCTTFEPASPSVPDAIVPGDAAHVVHLRPPVPEFALMVADLMQGTHVALPPDGPRIVLCLDGRVSLHGAGGTTRLRRGQSALVRSSAGAVEVAGEGHLVCVYVP